MVDFRSDGMEKDVMIGWMQWLVVDRSNFPHHVAWDHFWVPLDANQPLALINPRFFLYVCFSFPHLLSILLLGGPHDVLHHPKLAYVSIDEIILK